MLARLRAEERLDAIGDMGVATATAPRDYRSQHVRELSDLTGNRPRARKATAADMQALGIRKE